MVIFHSYVSLPEGTVYDCHKDARSTDLEAQQIRTEAYKIPKRRVHGTIWARVFFSVVCPFSSFFIGVILNVMCSSYKIRVMVLFII
jgi:hypothetical protein